MCKKLFVVLLVLGLVSSALAVDNDNIQVKYTMDSGDSIAGFMMNSATGTGSMGAIAMGAEVFLAANNGYVPGILGDAMVMSNDGMPDFDPCNPGVPWGKDAWEKANILNLRDVEMMSLPDMSPFEDKTVSMWFMQTAAFDPSVHHPANDGAEYLYGTYFTSTAFIALRELEGVPNVSFRAGTAGNVLGKDGTATGGNTRSEWYDAPIVLNQWYHVALVMKNTAGPAYHNMEASFYLDGALVGAEAGLTRDSDSFYWGGPQLMNRVSIGGYQNNDTDPENTTGCANNALVDDFGILNAPICGANASFVHNQGLAGFGLETIPEPATIALLGLGGLALLRRKR